METVSSGDSLSIAYIVILEFQLRSAFQGTGGLLLGSHFGFRSFSFLLRDGSEAMGVKGPHSPSDTRVTSSFSTRRPRDNSHRSTRGAFQ